MPLPDCVTTPCPSLSVSSLFQPPYLSRRLAGRLAETRSSFDSSVICIGYAKISFLKRSSILCCLKSWMQCFKIGILKHCIQILRSIALSNFIGTFRLRIFQKQDSEHNYVLLTDSCVVGKFPEQLLPNSSSRKLLKRRILWRLEISYCQHNSKRFYRSVFNLFFILFLLINFTLLQGNIICIQ